MKKILFLFLTLMSLKLVACNAPTNVEVVKTYATGFDISLNISNDTFFQILVFDNSNMDQEYYTMTSDAKIINGEFSFPNAGLDPNTEYKIKVREYCSSSSQSEWVEIIASTSEINPCSGPLVDGDNLFSNITDNNATVSIEFSLSWNSIQFHLKNATTDEVITTGNSSTGTFNLSDYATLLPNTTYSLVFRSECGDDNQTVYSPWSGPFPKEFTTTEQICNPPADLEVIESFTNGFKVTFEEVGSFHLQVIDILNNSVVGNYGNHTDNFTDGYFTIINDDILPNKEYKITVKKNCNGTYSELSEITATTLNDCDTPEVNIDNITEEGFDISAILPTNGVQYKVEIREINNGIVSEEIVQTYQLASSDYTVDNLDPEASYQIRIKTICSETNSSDWVTQNIVTEASCTAPTNITFSEITYNSAVATIEDVENALSYEYFLYKKETNQQVSNGATNNGGTVLNIPFSGELEPETTYQFKVRRKCQDNTWSEFTELYEFTTTEFVCLIPTDIEITDVTTESFNVNLNIEEGNIFQWKLYKDEEEIRTIDIQTNPSGYFQVLDLEENTTYKIKIKRLCLLNDVVFGSSEFTELFEVTTLDDLNISELEIEGLKIYPNPMNDILNFTSNETIQTIKIMDVLGKVIFEKSIQSKVGTINVSKLKVGVYYLLISSENKTNSLKVLKN
ncbi:T9SS type A sorting domain-containing protein [Aureivirga sp. CE67]|uniref:T9SS type A sorting domain-containing protein n=1 Tax=Aureivirga sp. CE67 TaxID=1788983 RepID=UPI0018C9E7A3|nr:T9SS type A sorting domain-containing protein [Aureivirga sp. CE67]